ncbi:hypothetical protein [Halostagnicola kamekurae]|uniref:Uncharacterized protein n=1 Tax=Halostagnicola kamekurae TaxID=619731 RepID=A0A1I6Q413_9EURY|nr:hypothetical protein [Halostagnicola kamekurae]SFS47187.1 hypothetical protein SAMN04488556_0968 [Halostagnicola kamekurae]
MTGAESGDGTGGPPPEPEPCPHCGAPVTAVIQLIPSAYHAYPCGCAVRGNLLE